MLLDCELLLAEVIEAADLGVSMEHQPPSLYAGPFSASAPHQMVAVRLIGELETDDYVNRGLARIQPTLQVLVRGEPRRYREALQLANQIASALHLPSTSAFLEVRAAGHPRYLGTDDSERHQFIIEVQTSYMVAAGTGVLIPLETNGSVRLAGDLTVDGEFTLAGQSLADIITELSPPSEVTQSELDAAVQGLDTQIDGLEADVTGLQTDLNDLSGEYLDLAEVVAGLGSDLTDTVSDLTVLEGLHAALSGTVTSHGITISGLVSDLSALTTTVSGHTTSISGLTASLSTVSGDLATHAALTAAHGATGAVVGTTNTQTLSNKTFSTKIDIIGPANGQPAIEMETGRSIKLGGGGVAISENGGSFFVNTHIQGNAGFIFKGAMYLDANISGLISNQTSASVLNNTNQPGWSIGCGNVIAAGKNIVGFISGGAQTGLAIDGTGSLKLATFTVAGAPSASTVGASAVIYVSNGDAGNPCIAVSDGTNWKRIALGATISAT